jgi:hypothetical protein
LVWSSTAILYVLIFLFYRDILTGAGSLSLEFLLLAGKIKGSLTRDFQFFSRISFPPRPLIPYWSYWRARVCECVCHSFANAAHFVFLRDVWIRTQRAAVASSRASATS